MNASTLALVCAPAGSGFKQAVGHLTKLLSDEPGVSVACEDVEDVLCEGSGAANALAGRLPTGAHITMKEVTWHLTRTEVTRLWRDAFAETVTHVRRVDNAKIRLLACHLNLYGGRRREFYSPFALEALSGVRVSHLLLLIDDIFDMYVRLSTEGHLYDEHSQAKGYIRMIMDDEADKDRPAGTSFGKETVEDLTLEWKTQVLTSLLAWRHAEMMLAESLASQLKAHYLVFGTKQLALAATRWLLDPEGESVYLSHPISRPRRQQQENPQKDKSNWPDVTEQFNGLQELLVKERVTAIMPTAIDEYRFRRADRLPSSELKPHLASLATRWPIPVDTKHTLYEPASDDAPELASLLVSDAAAAANPRWSPWIRALQSQIMVEVPFRDHHLVVCNGSILVFRPCYNSGRFSDGVRAEVEHWAELWAIKGIRRRALFLHFEEDIASVLTGLGATLDQRIQDALTKELESRGFSAAVAGPLAKAALKGTSPSLLDLGLDSTNIEHATLLAAEIPRKVIANVLTVDLLGKPDVALWVVRDNAHLVQRIPTIAAFLRFEVDAPTEWEKPVDAFLSIQGGAAP